jgi:hypothetical protein
MVLRFSKVLCVVLLTLSLGMHWALLQSVAWVGMVVSYAQDESLPTALAKTFDGKHPCKICRAVAEGKRSERAPQTKGKELKFDWLALRATLPPAGLDCSSSAVPSSDLDLPSNLEAPPIPPPRLA